MGFGVEGFAEHIPCPYCRRQDCSAIVGEGDRRRLVCSTTLRTVLGWQLREAAIDRLVERAEQAFWNEAASLVTHNRGDLPPDVAVHLKQTMRQALVVWLEVNEDA